MTGRMDCADSSSPYSQSSHRTELLPEAKQRPKIPYSLLNILHAEIKGIRASDPPSKRVEYVCVIVKYSLQNGLDKINQIKYKNIDPTMNYQPHSNLTIYLL